MTLDFTHNPSARSWVSSANEDGSHFPLQNLPLGVADSRIVVAIGDQALDVRGALAATGLLAGLSTEVQVALESPRLNVLLSLGRGALRAVRHAVFNVLKADSPAKAVAQTFLSAQSQLVLQLPCAIGSYTDFFTCYNHAYNCGTFVKRDQPVPPNFWSLPIAYHGRASSIVVSGTPVVRPNGQWRDERGDAVRFGPSQRLDFEFELGAVIGKGNQLTHPVPVDEAEQHIAGLCLLNDWSARDVQAWEAQPLGPFLSKNFTSSVSPWIVTLDALEPYRVAALERREGSPTLHTYLAGSSESGLTTYEIHTEVRLSTPLMREHGYAPALLSTALFSRDGGWTFSQMVAHHTIGGCNLSPGDLLGSGTISGPGRGEEGCLLELTRAGSEPAQLPGGESRSFLQDGDEIYLSAWCSRPGLPRIGFGTCVGEIMPARKLEQLL